MKLLILFILFFPFISFSQEADSTKHAQFHNIFGSDCDGDTILIDLEKNNQCILFKNENKLIRKRKGKIKWEIDLKKEFNSSEIKNTCIIAKGISKYNRKTHIFVLFDDNDENRTMLIKFSSGKVIKSVRQEYN